MKKNILLVIGLFVMLLVMVAPVSAAEYGGLGLYPAYPDPQNPLSEAYFIYNLVSAEEKNDVVVIRNTSNTSLAAKIYAVDGTTTADGSFTLEGANKEKKGLGKWITLPISEITVGPGEEKRVDFSIKIPVDASVGDYTGGIILENLDVQKGKGVNVVTRVGVRIYETVPGQLIRKMKITEFSWKMVNDKVVFYFGLENQGNTMLNPNGKLSYENSFGGKGEFVLNLGTVLQDKPTKVPVTWDKTPLIGQVKAKAVVNFGEGANDKLEREISFFYITKKAKVIALVIVLVLAVLVVLPSLRGKKGKKGKH